MYNYNSEFTLFLFEWSNYIYFNILGRVWTPDGGGGTSGVWLIRVPVKWYGYQDVTRLSTEIDIILIMRFLIEFKY